MAASDRFGSLAGLVLVAGWAVAPLPAEAEDPRAQPLIRIAAGFDRSAYGFSPLPTSGTVRAMAHRRFGCDALLELTGRTTRTIAFQRAADGYRVVGESEVFKGPDGAEITLSYRISGCVEAAYRPAGAAPAQGAAKYSAEEVRALLKAWGY